MNDDLVYYTAVARVFNEFNGLDNRNYYVAGLKQYCF